MDEFKKVIEQMNVETYQRLRRGVEIGKWPNGQVLSQEQRETSMQAVLAYEAIHAASEKEKTGYVDTASSDCHDDSGHHVGNPDESVALKWSK